MKSNNKFNIPINSDTLSFLPNELFYYKDKFTLKKILTRYVNQLSFGIHIKVITKNEKK